MLICSSHSGSGREELKQNLAFAHSLSLIGKWRKFLSSTLPYSYLLRIQIIWFLLGKFFLIYPDNKCINNSFLSVPGTLPVFIPQSVLRTRPIFPDTVRNNCYYCIMIGLNKIGDPSLIRRPQKVSPHWICMKIDHQVAGKVLYWLISSTFCFWSPLFAVKKLAIFGFGNLTSVFQEFPPPQMPLQPNKHDIDGKAMHQQGTRGERSKGSFIQYVR